MSQVKSDGSIGVPSEKAEYFTVILHVLPVHPIHGLINGLLTPLFISATVIMLPQFDASNAWEHLVQPDFEQHVTVFAAVSTIYSKLVLDCERK
ncbi:unnamed protein product [Rotaria sp. Silwood1]|nr:unnamed protein product [Rotaria sp. Silwood1]